MDSNYKKIVTTELNTKKLESTGECFKYTGISKVYSEEDAAYLYKLEDSKYYAVAYPILNGKVFLEGYVDTDNDNIVDEVIVKSGSDVYLSASSSKHSLTELISLSGISDGEGWSIGDKKDSRIFEFTSLKIQASKNRAEYASSKLLILLDLLEKNANGIRSLVEASKNCTIKIVIWNFYKEVEGMSFTNEAVKRIAALNLSIDIESYLVS